MPSAQMKQGLQGNDIGQFMDALASAVHEHDHYSTANHQQAVRGPRICAICGRQRAVHVMLPCLYDNVCKRCHDREKAANNGEFYCPNTMELVTELVPDEDTDTIEKIRKERDNEGWKVILEGAQYLRRIGNWAEYREPGAGQVFYFNKVLNEYSWEPPEEVRKVDEEAR